MPSSRISVLIADRPCPAVERAKKLEIPNVIVPPPQSLPDKNWDQNLLGALELYSIDVILLAGFLKKIGSLVLKQFSGRILNIHPALLPQFGGSGMYGRRVHEAVLASGTKESGATVHLVDEEFDHGPIVLQERLSILPRETPESLQKRIHELERRLYPKALAQFLLSPTDSSRLNIKSSTSNGGHECR